MRGEIAWASECSRPLPNNSSSDKRLADSSDIAQYTMGGWLLFMEESSFPCVFISMNELVSDYLLGDLSESKRSWTRQLAPGVPTAVWVSIGKCKVESRDGGVWLETGG